MADETTPYDSLLARVSYLETQVEVIYQVLASLRTEADLCARKQIETWDQYKTRIGAIK